PPKDYRTVPCRPNPTLETALALPHCPHPKNRGSVDRDELLLAGGRENQFVEATSIDQVVAAGLDDQNFARCGKAFGSIDQHRPCIIDIPCAHRSHVFHLLYQHFASAA